MGFGVFLCGVISLMSAGGGFKISIARVFFGLLAQSHFLSPLAPA